jgi:hypothetical protein
MTYKSLLSATALACASLTTSANAHDGDGGLVTYASDHAPIGVMADHRHKQGEWMVSYRYSYMDMEDNRDGTSSLSPETIATTVPNRFGMPPTLRVVPTQMDMNMHMVGGMYGLTDRITLMGMGMFMSNDMDHITFAGGMGDTRLGEFSTSSSGFGDTTLGAIVGLDDGSKAHRQINLGLAVSIPTGSNTETDTVLTPMNTIPELRLPYPMQLGSGTWDAKPSLTARTRFGRWSLGAQTSAIVRLETNAEGYKLGDRIEGTAWLAFEPTPAVSISGRLKARTQGTIDGLDEGIRAPVQTANPNFQGGDVVEALLGFNFAASGGALNGTRFAVEFGLPLYRDLNGPQLETDMTLTLGVQKAF